MDFGRWQGLFRLHKHLHLRAVTEAKFLPVELHNTGIAAPQYLQPTAWPKPQLPEAMDLGHRAGYGLDPHGKAFRATG
jgi:hypothetical protein